MTISDSGTELSIGESEPLPIPLHVEAKLAELHQEVAEKDDDLAAWELSTGGVIHDSVATSH